MSPGTPLRLVLAVAMLATVTAGCGSAGSSSPAATGGPVAGDTPTAELGVLPAVEGFTYVSGLRAVPGFVRGVEDSVGEEAGVEIVEAGLATRGADEVLVIAFGFPGTTDEATIDNMGRILDGMEDSLQAPAMPGLEGAGYAIDAEGQSVIMAPFARAPYLVLLFVNGPREATHDLARGILGAGG